MGVALGSRAATVVSPSRLSTARALHASWSLHGVKHGLSLISVLGSLELDRKSLTQLFDVDFAVS